MASENTCSLYKIQRKEGSLRDQKKQLYMLYMTPVPRVATFGERAFYTIIMEFSTKIVKQAKKLDLSRS